MKSMEQVLQKITVLTNSTNLLGNQHKKKQITGATHSKR